MDLAVLVLRLGLGVMFFSHGMQMAFGFWGGPGPNGFSKYLSGMGFAPAIFWAYLAAYTVLIGGLFLIAGFLTRFAAFSLLIFIVVAAVKVHLSKGFFISNGGYEYNWVIAFACLTLMIVGGGKFSIIKNL